MTTVSPTITSVGPAGVAIVSDDVLIPFLAAMARNDVQIAKKTLAELLHSVMHARADVFGDPPTASRQSRMSLVTVAPLGGVAASRVQAAAAVAHATSKQQRQGSSGNSTATEDDAEGVELQEDLSVLDAFTADRGESVGNSHRKALEGLTLTFATAMEVAAHVQEMRHLSSGDLRRAVSLIRAADDARRERVAAYWGEMLVSSEQRQHAAQLLHNRVSELTATGTTLSGDASVSTALSSASISRSTLDASLRIAEPGDFGVAVLHLRFALRKIVHACFRRLAPQQSPDDLAAMADMLHMMEDVLSSSRGRVGETSIHSATLRVILARAVVCAQAVGYTKSGHPAVLLCSSLPSSGTTQSDPSADRLTPLLLPPRTDAEGGLAPSSSLPSLGPVSEDGSEEAHRSSSDSLSPQVSAGPAAEEARNGVAGLVIARTARLESEAALLVASSSTRLPGYEQERVRRALRLASSQRGRRRRRQDRLAAAAAVAAGSGGKG